MSGLAIGLSSFGILFSLLFFRVHVATAMFLAGAITYLWVGDWALSSFLYTVGNLTYARLSNYDLTVIPLFILMGQLARYGGLSKALFEAGKALLGHFRGGMAYAATLACAAFGAICGSSVATAATMSQVALPELRRSGYSDKLANGVLVSGGTLGVLIPPSVPLVVYAVITQESLGKLFVAVIIPGLLAVLGYCIVIFCIVTRNPSAGPASEKVGWRTRVKAQVSVLPIAFVFLVIIGGIYGGWASPTEAASVAVAAVGLTAAFTGNLGWKKLTLSIYGTASISAMIFFMLIGADLLNSSLALSRLPNELVSWVGAQHLPAILVLLIIIFIYLVLGAVMDSLAMILLTVPIFYPIVMELDLFSLSQQDKSIWFGILMLMVVEIGLVTPPIGMNLFIINRAAVDVPMRTTILGVIPFLISDLLRVLLLIFFPILTLWLVSS